MDEDGRHVKDSQDESDPSASLRRPGHDPRHGQIAVRFSAAGMNPVKAESRGSIEIHPRDLMVRDADMRGVMLANTPSAELAECRAAIKRDLADARTAQSFSHTFVLA